MKNYAGIIGGDGPAGIFAAPELVPSLSFQVLLVEKDKDIIGDQVETNAHPALKYVGGGINKQNPWIILDWFKLGMPGDAGCSR